MKSIKVILKSNDVESTNNYKAIVNNKKIIYNDECKVVIDYNDYLIVTKENDDYLLELIFKENKCRYFLKKENSEIFLNLITDYIIIENNLIMVKYNIKETNNNVLYRLEILK